MKMTDQEVLDALVQDTPLNRARRKFSSAAAHIEQAGQQRKPLTPINLRRLEFEAVEKIVTAYGVPALVTVLNYVADMTYCGADAEWHFKPGYNPQRVLDALS
jgi:hypothetical protein